MKVNKVEIENFKSFKNSIIELDDFNILIGSNACGKSNFIQIFRFLKDIENEGLENAISMQGGIEYLRNMNLGNTEPLRLKIEMTPERSFLAYSGKGKRAKVNYLTYEFILEFHKTRLGFRVIKDTMIGKLELFKVVRKNKKTVKFESLGEGELSTSKIRSEIKQKFIPPVGVDFKKEDVFFPFRFRRMKHTAKNLLLESPFLLEPYFQGIFGGISIYDFDPKLPKKSTPIRGKITLEEDGSNLALVLNNIKQSREKERRFSNLIRDFLPFVEKIEIDKFVDKSLIFKLKEKYFPRKYLPASLVSDGTIHITALIIAVYFKEYIDESNLTIIEEPERNIHPYLIAKVVDMMKNASKFNQILATTHNPEVVRNADLKNLLLIYRDKEGFSKISRPAEKADVKNFLENEIGIEELYIQNLLE